MIISSEVALGWCGDAVLARRIQLKLLLSAGLKFSKHQHGGANPPVDQSMRSSILTGCVASYFAPVNLLGTAPCLNHMNPGLTFCIHMTYGLPRPGTPGGRSGDQSRPPGCYTSVPSSCATTKLSHGHVVDLLKIDVDQAKWLRESPVRHHRHGLTGVALTERGFKKLIESLNKLPAPAAKSHTLQCHLRALKSIQYIKIYSKYNPFRVDNEIPTGPRCAAKRQSSSGDSQDASKRKHFSSMPQRSVQRCSREQGSVLHQASEAPFITFLHVLTCFNIVVYNIKVFFI